MFELLFEGLVSLVTGIVSFLSGIFTQQAVDKTISLKKLFWLVFFALLIVMVTIEASCIFNKNCISFSWKMVALEFMICIGLGLFTVGLVKLSFLIKLKKKG
jgi:RsiW-degrading membrane proteinase PrsW (M82 family)